MDWKIQLTNWRPRHKLVLYLIPAIIIDIILILTNNLTLNALGLHLLVWDEYKTTMTFDGKLIYKEDDLTFLINNGNKSDSKILVIYGLDRAMSVKIAASHITDETTNTFENLAFGTPKLVEKNNEEYHHQIDVSISEPLKPGSYQGWIFIKNNDMNLYQFL